MQAPIVYTDANVEQPLGECHLGGSNPSTIENGIREEHIIHSAPRHLWKDQVNTVVTFTGRGDNVVPVQIQPRVECIRVDAVAARYTIKGRPGIARISPIVPRLTFWAEI